MTEHETDVSVGGIQADLAEPTQPDEIHDCADVVLALGADVAKGKRRMIGALIFEREQLAREEELKSHVRFMTGKDDRIACLEQRIAFLAESIERYREVRLERDALRAEVNDYAVQRNENEVLKTENERLSALCDVEHANGLARERDQARGMNAEVVMAHARAVNDADQIIKDLRAELAEEASSRDRMSSLLHQTANALKGVPDDPLRMHGWVDLPEVAQKLKAEVSKLKDDLAIARKDAREMARAIGYALNTYRNGSHSGMADRMAAHMDGLDCVKDYVDGGEP
jgi:hypothetical protein